MREFSPDLKAHLSGVVTTLCTAWKLELLDGRTFGFSEHDRDLFIDGVTYRAQSSLTETQSESRLGYASDNGGVQGVLEATLITRADIESGLLKGAKLSRFRVNWQAPESFVLLSVGELGQVTLQGDYFDVEWLGLSSKLGRSTGRVFSKKCDAELGDTRCGIDLENFAEGTLCSKSLSVCAGQFNNASNFRGFPYLLGDDALYAAPQEGELKDGGSRYL